MPFFSFLHPSQSKLLRVYMTQPEISSNGSNSVDPAFLGPTGGSEADGIALLGNQGRVPDDQPRLTPYQAEKVKILHQKPGDRPLIRVFRSRR